MNTENIKDSQALSIEKAVDECIDALLDYRKNGYDPEHPSLQQSIEGLQVCYIKMLSTKFGEKEVIALNTLLNRNIDNAIDDLEGYIGK